MYTVLLMNLFSLETRKKNTVLVVTTVSKIILDNFNNKIVSAYLLVGSHISITLFVIVKLINSDVVSWYYLYTIIWICIIFSNYYFHGCILARIEQRVLQDNTWTGPASLLFYPLHLFYKPNTQIMNDYIKYFWCAPICSIIILKYLFEDWIVNKFIGICLMTIFIPLLFIYSQSDIICNHINKIL